MCKIVSKKADGSYVGMSDIYDSHLKNLLRAILEVKREYFYYATNNVAGDSELQEQLERIFAYELYHQWSIIQKEKNDNSSDQDKRIINGEGGKKLDGVQIYPDLILHKGQKDMEHQEIAVEIKRKVGLQGDNLIRDLIKLSKLITYGKLAYNAKEFKYGVFILTGGVKEDIISLLTTNQAKDVDDRIICIFCNGDNQLSFATMGEIKSELI